jgi:hypothetical protein
VKAVAARHVESDALEALRAELVGAARRRVTRRRRRRRGLAVAAAAVGLLAAAAGAGALNELSTGVPVVDELLEVEAPSLMDEPAGDATERLPVPTNDGTAQSVAYLRHAGTICQVEAERHPRIEGSVRGGGGGCLPAADMARLLDRHGVRWAGSSHGPERRIFHGFADGDVESIRVLGQAAGAEVRMTKPWIPRIEGGEALRLFVVIDERDIDVGDDGVQPGELPVSRLPPVELTYAGGRTQRIEAP